MADPQTEFAPQFMRLFHVSGLIEQADWDAWQSRQQKHKPILDVLTQQVSLGTFRDLFNAEITFTRQASRGHESGLHEGLAAAGMINDEELKALLKAHPRPVQALIEPLRSQGVLSEDACQRAEARAQSADGQTPDWLVTEGFISASMICHWLGKLEAVQMRQSALFMALYVLHYNTLLAHADFTQAQTMLQPERRNDLLRLVQKKPALSSARLAEKIETLTLPEIQFAALPAGATLMLGQFPQSLIRRQLFVPFSLNGPALGLATFDPLNIPLVALLNWIFGLWPVPYLAPGGAIIEQINRAYAKSGNGAAGAPALKPAAAAPVTPVRTPVKPAPAPVEERPSPRGGARVETEIALDGVSAVQLVSSLIESAIELRTTDIHIEPTKKGLLIRFRIDGELHRVMNVPAALAQSVISRVKVLADMDVTERRRPQDGHFELRVDSHNFDFRISTLPAVLGEKIVIRILDESQVQTGLDKLGLLADQQRLVQAMVAQSYGMILVTGPTGSGKTSTLYAAMNTLNSESRNLVTIEDPVEYQVEGVNQVQVDPHIGLTFSDGLRSILRQDPDVIMVGEIRDSDTAHIAIRAALTGHLVFSTLHTNTALGAVDALMHLGAVPFMVANSLIGIIAQRLVRRLCKSCRKAQKMTPALAAQLGLDEGCKKRLWRAGGCDECLGSGYLGRTGVFEVIRINEALRPKITTHHFAELEQAIREQRMISLAEAGVQKVLDGITSVEEITRKVMLDI